MLLWTKIKQKNLQICVDHAALCTHFCKKKHTQKWAWLLCILFCNHNYQGGTGEFIYKADIRQQTVPLKHDRQQSHISAVHHQNCLPCRQLYILLSLPSLYLHYSYSYSQLYIGFYLSNRAFQQNSLKYLATVQVFLY